MRQELKFLLKFLKFLEAGTEISFEAMEECCLLACSPWLDQHAFSYSLGTYPGATPPIVGWDLLLHQSLKYIYIFPQTSLVEAFSQLCFLFPDNCVKTTKQAQTTTNPTRTASQWPVFQPPHDFTLFVRRLYAVRRHTQRTVI